VGKTNGKDSSEACAIARQNCVVYSVFPSGTTSQVKSLNITECKGHLRDVEVKLSAIQAPILDRYEWSDIGSYRFDLILLCLCILIVSMLHSVYSAFCRANWHSPATLTEVFPYFFLSCKANAGARIPRKDGARSAFFLISEFCCSICCLYRLRSSMYCLCVYVYRTTATGCQPKCS